MNDLFDYLGSSLYNSVSNLHRPIHSKIVETELDNFIHELMSYLSKYDVSYRLSKLPKDTLLEINELEEKNIDCYFNREKYTIPKSMIAISEIPKYNDGGLYLQLQNDGLYHVIDRKKES